MLVRSLPPGAHLEGPSSPISRLDWPTNSTHSMEPRFADTKPCLYQAIGELPPAGGQDRKISPDGAGKGPRDVSGALAPEEK